MFHYSNFGSFAPSVRDMDGFVAEATDNDPWAFNIDHGGERTHNDDGSLTEYGEWWEEDGFPEWRDRAVAETATAEEGLVEWRSNS